MFQNTELAIRFPFWLSELRRGRFETASTHRFVCAGKIVSQPLLEAASSPDKHLGIALRRKAMTARAFELRAWLSVVVDLSVLDDGDAAVLVRDRLVATREVDDRQPSRC